MIPQIIKIFNDYKTPILYSGGSIAKAFAQLIVGFFIAKYVSPEDLGLWTTINLILIYSSFLQVGLINGLNLELPFAYGKGDNKSAEIMAGTVQSFTIISSIILLVSATIYLITTETTNPKEKLGIIAIVMVTVLTFYQNYLLSTFRSKSSFKTLSIIQLVDAFVNISTLVLVIYFSYYGLLLKAIVVICVYVLLLHFNRPIKIGFILSKKAFFLLLKVGLPIFGLAYLETVSSTFDKIWLLKYSNLSDVGLYSFAFYSLTAFSLFSTSIASYIYPRMTYNYGKSNNKHDLWLYAKKITKILIIIQTPLSIIGYIMIPILIRNYFPNYILSTHAMQILLFAGLFKGSVVAVNALWSLKEWKLMIIYQVLYSILIVSFTFVGVFLHHNKIEGVAYGILFANAINFIVGISLTYLGTNRKGSKPHQFKFCS